MSRRIFTALTVGVLVVVMTGPLAAADPPQHRHRRPLCSNQRALARILRLTPEQVEHTRIIYGAFRDTVEPLREEIPPLREELAALLDEEDPAAGEVGQVVVDIDALHDQIGAARKAADEEFEALLTEEQLARWEKFRRDCRPGYEP